MKTIMKKMSMFLVALVCLVIITSQKVVAADAINNGSIKWNQNYSGTIAGESVIYDFTLKQSGKVAVTFTYADSDVNNSCFVIRDKAGNNMIYKQVGNGTYTVSVDLLAGEYEIAMWQNVYKNTEVNYAFVNSFKASGETVNEFNTKKNNEVTSASSYTLKKSRKGQFAVNDDTDIYKVKLKKNVFLKLNVNGQIKKMDVSVQSAKGDVSYSETNVPMGKRVYTYFCPKGTYYITFKSTNTGNYSFNTSLSEIPAISLKKASNVSKKSLFVKWSRKSTVVGYQVQYSTNKSFKKGNKIYNVSDVRVDCVTIPSLKAGKKYYVRVRTYVTDHNGKMYYSKWSKVKTITVKK
ncbi:MAG: fibronectin type III domain-containing protein [Eubacteriales bacterium]|nr:fibronectin type III domain-containing protein [Eubacteriales bacterium]